MKQGEKPKVLIMIFGATGDLANRKLFPSLYQLYEKGKISEQICGDWGGEKKLTNEQFQENVKKSVQGTGEKKNNLNDFISHFYYHSHDVTDSNSYTALNELANQFDEQYA